MVAPERFAPVRVAPDRFAPVKVAPDSWALLRMSPDRLQPASDGHAVRVTIWVRVADVLAT